jgi:GDP-L-fucose synthase
MNSLRPLILVTGGNGLVGSAIQYTELISIGLEKYTFKYLSSKDGNLVSFEETKEIFQKYKPLYVIHLAARVGGLYRNSKENIEMYEDNLLMGMNVIKCCDMFDVKRSVFCLSTCIFPDDIEYPINAEQLHDGPPHPSNKGYAYAKRMIQVHTELYNDKYRSTGDERRMVCIVPTNVYGKYDNFNLQESHVIPGLIHKCYLAFKNNTPFVVKGTGVALRQFVYSEDLAKLIIWVLLHRKSDTPIILAPKEEYSIKFIAESIHKIFGEKLGAAATREPPKLQYDTSYGDGQYRKTANHEQLEKYFEESDNNDKVFRSIEDGLDETIEWFIENFECSRTRK